MSGEPDAQTYCGGVLAGDRRQVAKAITLLESTRVEHRALQRLAVYGSGDRT